MEDICVLLKEGRKAKPTFQEFTEVVGADLNSAPIEAGFPTAAWHWDEMPQSDFDRLLGFIGATGSATVYIYTQTNEGSEGCTFATYTAVMHRPTKGDRIETDVTDVNVEFTGLVLVP